MTQVARVFVFLNLVLAAAFLAAAATFLGLQKEYTQALEDKKQELEAFQAQAASEKEALDNTISDLRRAQGTLTNEKTQVDADLRAAQGEIADLKGQVSEKDNQIRTLGAGQQTLSTAVDALRGDKNNLQGQVDDANEKARNAVARQTEAVDAKEAAEAEAANLRSRINDLEVANNEQSEKIADLENVIAVATAAGFSLEGALAMDPVSGQVLNYDAQTKLVQVNRGSAQGVQRGYTLDLTSNGRYLGRMKVDGMTANTCYGVLTIDNTNGAGIPVGAGATNRLN